MATPDNNPADHRLRQIGGAIAGTATGAAVYCAEAYVAYAAAEVIKTGFQSPDALSSAVSILCLLGIAAIGLHDLSTNQGRGIRGVLLSGARVGLAVNQAVLEA